MALNKANFKAKVYIEMIRNDTVFKKSDPLKSLLLHIFMT